jgi:hypothetical protein
MRLVFLPHLLLVLGLAGCTEPLGAFAAANAASVTVFGRAIPDFVTSAVVGKNCSVVRLDQGNTYCADKEAPPPSPRYCTRSLGVVDCWSNPEKLPGPPPEVADGPRELTPAQEANRTRGPFGL